MREMREMREEHIANFNKEQKIARESPRFTEELEKEHDFREREIIARESAKDAEACFDELVATIHKLQQ